MSEEQVQHTQRQEKKGFWKNWYMLVLFWHLLVIFLMYIFTLIYHPVI